MRCLFAKVSLHFQTNIWSFPLPSIAMAGSQILGLMVEKREVQNVNYSYLPVALHLARSLPSAVKICTELVW